MPDVPEGFPKFEKTTRPWRCLKGRDDCERKKPCPACLGRRNKIKGRRKQSQALKTLERLTGTQAGKYSSTTGHEENWRLSIRAEVKAGAQVSPIWTRYRNARAQSDAAHAVGDPRPFVYISVPDGLPKGKFLTTVHSDDLEAFALAILGELT